MQPEHQLHKPSRFNTCERTASQQGWRPHTLAAFAGRSPAHTGSRGDWGRVLRTPPGFRVSEVVLQREFLLLATVQLVRAQHRVRGSPASISAAPTGSRLGARPAWRRDERTGFRSALIAGRSSNAIPSTCGVAKARASSWNARAQPAFDSLIRRSSLLFENSERTLVSTRKPLTGRAALDNLLCSPDSALNRQRAAH